jgi:Domain of unknown function (DUF4352)
VGRWGGGGGTGSGAAPPGAPGHPTAAFGSLPYVAPEQARGEAAGPAADLWALGATLWFAVEGAAPFERASPAATLGAILHDLPGRPVRAGPLGPVLLALLDKDPARRPPAAAVRRTLEPLAAPSPAPTMPLAEPTEVLPVPGPPAGWGEPRPPRPRRGDPVPPAGWTAPPRRRRRWGRRLLVAAAVLVLAALANAAGDAGRRADRGPAGLGDPVRDGQFQFVVGSLDCGARSVGQGFGRKQALGQFCLVGLRVENTGAEGRTFGGGQQYLFDRAGNRHDPDLDATARLGGGRLWSAHLNPGQRLAGTLVYDVPEGVELARVELHDGPLSGGASVSLG